MFLKRTSQESGTIDKISPNEVNQVPKVVVPIAANG